MSKIRVFELAEELQIPAEKLVEALRDLNMNISNQMSMIDTQVAGIIREVIKKQRKRKPAEKPKEAPRDLPPAPTPNDPPMHQPVAEPKVLAPDVTSSAKPIASSTAEKNKPKSSTQPEKGRDKRFKDDEVVVDRKLQQGRGRNRQDNRRGGRTPTTHHREQQSSKVVVENAMTVGELSKASTQVSYHSGVTLALVPYLPRSLLQPLLRNLRQAASVTHILFHHA